VARLPIEPKVDALNCLLLAALAFVNGIPAFVREEVAMRQKHV
jgi:hypothetical protein